MAINECYEDDDGWADDSTYWVSSTARASDSVGRACIYCGDPIDAATAHEHMKSRHPIELDNSRD